MLDAMSHTHAKRRLLAPHALRGLRLAALFASRRHCRWLGGAKCQRSRPQRPLARTCSLPKQKVVADISSLARKRGFQSTPVITDVCDKGEGREKPSASSYVIEMQCLRGAFSALRLLRAPCLAYPPAATA